jgi:Flp pilus assembly CpaF family ATPase
MPVTFDDLLKAALRWRPDRIILGEVRGIEARTLLDSFNTGHAGSLATIHANSAAKALRRFANLVLRSHSQATFEDIEAEIGEAVDYVVHVERQPGRRVIREVLKLNGYDRTAQRSKWSKFSRLEARRLREASHAENSSQTAGITKRIRFSWAPDCRYRFGSPVASRRRVDCGCSHHA